METSEVNFWFLLAGLGLFLFGMYLLEDSLKGLVGRSFKIFLRKYTKQPLQAVFAGTVATSVLQSSAMVILLVMSFAGAGVIGLESGIGMIMGANLGTTATGWLISLIGFQFKISAFVYPLISIGGIGYVFVKRDRWRLLFGFILGFSLMFLGLDYMKIGFESYAQSVDLSFLKGGNLLLFVLTGTLLSAGIQSSSGAMMIFLSSLAAGVITLNQGFYLVIGAGIGTTITAVIGTVGGNSIRKKIGWAHVVFNVLIAIVGIFLVGIVAEFITEQLHISEATIALVLFHSFLNLMGIILILPFLKSFTRFINWLIPSKETTHSKFITLISPFDIKASIEALEKESIIFITKAMDTNSHFFHTSSKILDPEKGYLELKAYEAEIVDFYMKLLQGPLEAKEANKVNQLIGVFRNATLSAKDIKDVRMNLLQLKGSGSDHLFELYKKLCVNQLDIYTHLKVIIDQLDANNLQNIDALDVLHMNYHNEETQTLQKIFNESKHRDVDMPSLLNMIREVNNSNEALLNSLHHFKELKNII